MITLHFAQKLLPVAILTALLSACGGGGSSDDVPSTNPPISESTISGTASKGILQNALVTAYKITADGKKGEKLSSTTTNADGAYSFKVQNYSGAVLLELTSDANTKMLCDIPTGCDGTTFGQPVSATGLSLQTVLAELKDTNKTAITPFTHLASKYAEKNGYNKANIEKALTQIADLFNLTDINNTTPINAAGNFTSASEDEQRYAIMNAAIAEMSGKISNISTKIKALSDEINAKDGQLQSSEVGATNNKLDLADVLAAASNVADNKEIKDKIKASLKTRLANQLSLAQQTQGNTTATPSSGAGTDDLNKAKTFVNSASQLLATLQQYDNQNFLDSLKSKTATIDTLIGGDQLLGEALGAAIVVLINSVDESQTTRVLGKTDIDKLLAQNFNLTYELVATASNDAKLTIDATSHTVTLTGELKLQSKKRLWNGLQYTAVNNGAEQVFTISNIALSYPAETTSSSTFTFAVDANSKIKTTDLELSLASNSDSKIIVTYAKADTFKNHRNALDSSDNDTPTRLDAKLDHLTLKALKAGNTEFSQFVGNMNLSAISANLDTATGKLLWPMPELVTLSGSFSSQVQDLIEATASIDLKGSNLKVAPEVNTVRTGLYNYQYNATQNTITIKPTIGTFIINGKPEAQLVINFVSCGIGIGQQLRANNSSYGFSNCTNQTNIADAYHEFIVSNTYYRYLLMTRIENEGGYYPLYDTNFNYKSTNTNINGVLDWSEGWFYEDGTHLGKGTVTLNTKIKLVGNTSADIDAQITANYAGQKNGDVSAVLRVANDKLSLSSTVIGGQPTITLTNKDGVSIEAKVVELENKIEIKIGGKVQGSIYKLNGLPVAKFIDNSLKAL